MTNDELIAMLAALRRYGVETYEVGLSGPKVKFFAPKETIEPGEWQTTQHTSLPAANLPVKLRDLLWSTPEWSEDQESAVQGEQSE